MLWRRVSVLLTQAMSAMTVCWVTRAHQVARVGARAGGAHAHAHTSAGPRAFERRLVGFGCGAASPHPKAFFTPRSRCEQKSMPK
eukprot:2829237-Prymnesium_polylepis.1